MRLIKAFLAGITGLFVVTTLLSLLIPSSVKVSRVVLISNTTTANVYTQIATLYNWKNWHPVFKSNDAVVTFPKADKNVYCEISYNNKVTKLTVIAADTSSVKFILQSAGENDIENEIAVAPVPGQKNVQVQWNAYNILKWYPWEKFYGIFIDKLTGPGYDAALNGLKEYLESH